MDIIKGQTQKIRLTIYSYWSGQESTSTLANLTGATVKAFFKRRATDLDNAALITKTATIIDAGNGVAEFTLTASDTNGISDSKLVWEPVAKLSDNSFIRNGVGDVNLLPNVGKELF